MTMENYTAHIEWQRGEHTFSDGQYSRAHVWRFDGGIEVPASSSPHVVPTPLSLEAAVDPEEAFVASLSSCHMLWFLAIAKHRHYIVDSYVDNAIGIMEKNENGQLAITRVILKPHVVLSGERQASQEDLAALHHAAHESCFIANSVKTEVLCEPVFER